MTSQSRRAVGIACLAGAVVLAMIAFGIITVWPYDPDSTYQAYVDGRSVGDSRSGASILAQNNSATSVLIVPLLVLGISMLRTSRTDDESRATAASRWSVAAIVGGAGAFLAYAGFLAQYVDQGDLWLGNPLVVMWLSPALMVPGYFVMGLEPAAGPRTAHSARQGLSATLGLVVFLSTVLIAFVTYGVIDGFIPLGVAIAVSALMFGMTAALGVVVLRQARRP